MGVSYGIDLSKLDVCFGGFSPTLMGDAAAAQESMEAVRQRVRERKTANERAAQAASARESDEKVFTDSNGIEWLYVEIDESEIRIVKCNPAPNISEVIIPETLGGKSVIALAQESFSQLDGVTRIIVPDCVIAIGACAFRSNDSLESVELSAQLSEFKSDWFRGCNNLAHLTLPGNLETIKPSVFDIPNLRSLSIGAATQSVEPGAFAKSGLETVNVHSENPFLKTDGMALYSKDGAVMVALAVPCESYNIEEGCNLLANKAFSTMSCVKSVNFPSTLEVIGNFSLAKTGLESFDAPEILKVIMEKAFFDCASLRTVLLNDELVAIGKNAFTATALESLTLPAGIKQIDYPIADRTSLTYSGPNATFRLNPDSRYISMDEHGGLYRKAEDGQHLIRMLDPHTRRYSIQPGTTVIEENAFAGHPSIEQVNIPKSTRIIEKAAFKDAHALKEATIEEGLESIGEEAFLNTSLSSIFISASLKSIGQNALVTRGSRHGDEAPTLHDISVSPNNPRFYKTGGMLLERKNERTSKVVVFADDRKRVEIPAEVDEISPYAFNGSARIEELFMSDRISTIGIRGLTVQNHISLIHVNLVQPIEGHDHFEFRFPATTRGIQQQFLALSTSAFVNVEALFDHYDASIVNASSFDSYNEEGLGLYDQAVSVMDRLCDPVYLSESNRAMCERILSKGVEQICVEMAKRDDRASIDRMAELGFLNKDNILAVIDRVGAVQDASMTAYLLEKNRGWTTLDDMDFEL